MSRTVKYVKASKGLISKKTKHSNDVACDQKESIYLCVERQKVERFYMLIPTNDILKTGTDPVKWKIHNMCMEKIQRCNFAVCGRVQTSDQFQKKNSFTSTINVF